MLDRFESILKFVCLALAVILLLQIVRRVAHPDPLGNASIPPLPTLSAPANSAAAPGLAPKNTNAVARVAATNSTGRTNAVLKDTNMPAQAKSSKRHRNAGPHFGGPMAAADLPPAIQARVDRIKESEILGPFMRPPPMALLGIADDDAFLRAPDGQTGLVKEGGELGGIKLLRIGINRVLIEENGEKKELTLFDGFGSESLMPKESEPARERNKHAQPEG